MKRSYFALALVFVGAVTGARMISPAPGATVSPSTSSEVKKAQPVTTVARTPEPTMVVSTAPASRPPVPLWLRSRPKPVVTTAANIEIASRDASTTATDAVPTDAKPRNDSFAKTAIEQDGYKGVRDLTKGADGLWRGRALRGTTEVAISVDANGNVSAE